MTEKDLDLKIGVRKLFWRMGFSTRIDVPLRGFPPPRNEQKGSPQKRSRPAPAETFTDLDVLGVALAPGYRVRTVVADCKTSRRDSTERMFWVRGVADLFGCDESYLVRQDYATDAARQLANRLSINVLTGEQLSALEEMHPHIEEMQSGALNILFDRGSVEVSLKAFTGMDSQLRSLLDYRQFDYWVYEPHRNPFQLIAHLEGARSRLNSKDPLHNALIFDLAWLYLLSLISVTEYVRSAFLDDVDRALQEYLFGGPVGLREKQQTARVLKALASNEDRTPLPDLFPEYYSDLRELVMRLLRRPDRIQCSLRYAETAAAFSSNRLSTPMPTIYSNSFDEIAAKLLLDVVSFMVAAAGLDSGFRARARSILMGDSPSRNFSPLEQKALTLPFEGTSEKGSSTT